MSRRALSMREQGLVEDAVTQICQALGVCESDPELRQAAWAEILAVYRQNPQSFAGPSPRGWQQAGERAAKAIRSQVGQRQGQVYRHASLDAPLRGDTEFTLLQLLHSSSGNFENGVCLFDFLSRQHPDVRRLADGLLDGESLWQVQRRNLWPKIHALWARDQLRAAMAAYLEIQ